jgi:hypothetical protein
METEKNEEDEEKIKSKENEKREENKFLEDSINMEFDSDISEKRKADNFELPFAKKAKYFGKRALFSFLLDTLVSCPELAVISAGTTIRLRDTTLFGSMIAKKGVSAGMKLQIHSNFHLLNTQEVKVIVQCACINIDFVAAVLF